MTLSSGAFRAIAVVRKNQLKIKDLACHEADATVLRRPGILDSEFDSVIEVFNDGKANNREQPSHNGHWCKVTSADIFPGDIFVIQKGTN